VSENDQKTRRGPRIEKTWGSIAKEAPDRPSRPFEPVAFNSFLICDESPWGIKYPCRNNGLEAQPIGCEAFNPNYPSFCY
jgi:hypothetical protein